MEPDPGVAPPRVAFVFPGQGAQYVGMGKAFYDAYPEAREVFLRANDALGFDLARVCFEGPEPELTRTAITQPAILATSVAILAVLEKLGVGADVAAGLSLGEYSALVWAGALAFDDAVRVVHKRGALMQEAVPEGEGTMAAIMGLDRAVVESLCQQASTGGIVVEPSNYNAPGQVVISGHVAGVERAVALAREAGARRAQRLNVSAPFHCRLLEPAARRLSEVLAEVPIADPKNPVAANVHGGFVTSAEEVRRALIEQVARPVRWEDCVRTLAGAGAARFVEVGPGRALCGFVRRIVPEAETHSAEDPSGLAACLERQGGLC